MPAPVFFERFGFSADPFESTNAEQEPLLADYFVPPPFFPTVMGDTDRPHSHVVLAPRGGGKTAQRRMIEVESQATQDFLCVTYDVSEQAPANVGDATWAFHVNQVCRRLLIAILLVIEQDRFLVDTLTLHQRQLLRFQLERFLGPISVQEFREAVGAVKTFGNRASDFWNKYGGPIAAAVQILLNKAGFGDVQIPPELAEHGRMDESLRYHLNNLLEIVYTLGFKSTYVLVDKVDESSVTEGDASATFEFVRRLLTDLATLEAPHCGFKFFLWDRIGPLYREGGGRPDRVPILELHWTVPELRRMLEARLRAYSGGAVESLNQMMCLGSHVDLHSLAAYMGAGSPRDMIRFVEIVVDETTKTGDNQCISDENIWDGISTFSEAIALELCPVYLPDLKRIGSPSFTVNFLASDVFHVTTQSARSRVQKWMNTGIVEKIGERPNPPNRPLHLYGIVDLRVAIAANPATDVRLVLDNFVVECPGCRRLVVTGEASIDCSGCGTAFTLSIASSLLSLCSIP